MESIHIVLVDGVVREVLSMRLSSVPVQVLEINSATGGDEYRVWDELSKSHEIHPLLLSFDKPVHKKSLKIHKRRVS